jgi:hypothetical protein
MNGLPFFLNPTEIGDVFETKYRQGFNLKVECLEYFEFTLSRDVDVIMLSVWKDISLRVIYFKLGRAVTDAYIAELEKLKKEFIEEHKDIISRRRREEKEKRKV